MNPRPRLRKAPLLALHALEDRATPAAGIHTAATQALTITAAQGDQLLIQNETGKPSGYILVTETQSGANVFDSNVTHWAVKNVAVRFNNVSSGGLTLDQIGTVPGNLAIAGATGSQMVD